jgi:hypothetical protein
MILKETDHAVETSTTIVIRHTKYFAHMKLLEIKLWQKPSCNNEVHIFYPCPGSAEMHQRKLVHFNHKYDFASGFIKFQQADQTM